MESRSRNSTKGKFSEAGRIISGFYERLAQHPVWKRYSRKTDETKTGGQGRIIFIDALRGYAILMMLQGHVIQLTLMDSYRDSGYLLYAAWSHMRGLTAPVFFFASGMIIAYLLCRTPKNEKDRRVKKFLKRGGKLLFLGYLLQSGWWTVKYLVEMDAHFWSFLSRTHVLHSIAVGMIVIALLSFSLQRVRWMFPIVVFILANAAFVFGSMVTIQSELPDYISILSTYILKQHHAAFPILTWLGFPLFGALVGYLLSRWPLQRSLLFFAAMIVLGYVVKENTRSILEGISSLFVQDYSEAMKYSVFTYFRLGETFMIAGIIGILSILVKLPAFLMKSGRETLAIYFLHTILVYGSIVGFGLKSFWRRALTPAEAVALAVFVVLLFIAYAMNADAIRKKLPFLKFLR